jgi:Tfp pilus assembly protein PilF
MRRQHQPGALLKWTVSCVLLGLAVFLFAVRLRAVEASRGEVRILEIRGKVDIQRSGATAWDPAYTNQVLKPGDRGSTREHSHVVIQLSDRSVLRFGERSQFQIQSPADKTDTVWMHLRQGLGYFFSRDTPEKLRLNSPTAAAAVRGTELVISVDAAGRTSLVLLEGEAELSNDRGTAHLASGEEGTVEPDRPPAKTSVGDTANVIQWLLYYPAVIEVAEVPFHESGRTALAASIEAYCSGDLPQALARCPAGFIPPSDAERGYYAGLLISAGQVEEAVKILDSLSADSPLAGALREMLAAVLRRPFSTNRSPVTASEWLARSYYQQKDFDLDAALASARKAVAISPNFAFGWVRVAELEFSFGRRAQALSALNKALALAPRHAQAHALKGFLLAAANRLGPAQRAFETAMALDGALGNAWLGRGLCRIQRGDRSEGQTDLLVAAALEPNRSLLRSYLGKSLALTHDDSLAGIEFKRAQFLDPSDPTPWLYAALWHCELNRINESVQDLERSLDLNDNRQVYRSRLLLDQDRALRSASLATIYQRAGMAEVSLGEAARSVSYDYANYSAHQFLAESFDLLRDPTRFNLRYETAWFNELLLANLLSPAGAGTLSQQISNQEYTKFFTLDRLGITTDSLWRSDGQFQQRVSQFGTYRNSSYALDLDYQHNDGIRPNNELERLEWYTRIKQQLTPEDSVFLLAKYQDYRSGDNYQYFFPTNVQGGFSFQEEQLPILVAGYHREWAPGVHTLLLGGRLSNEQCLHDTNTTSLVLFKDLTGQVTGDASAGFDMNYSSEFEAWTSELNQIFATDSQTLVLGARFQTGQIQTDNTFEVSDPTLSDLFNRPAAEAQPTEDFERVSGYCYYTLEPFDKLRLTGGLAYEDVTYPENFRNPPISAGSESREKISPKAALMWTPCKEITLRGAYTQSLGGVTLDESIRLEPTQLAGFVQSYRTLISESLAGSVSAPEYETGGVAVDLKLPSETYLTFSAEWLQQDVDRTVGAFELNNATLPIISSSTPESLAYDEKSAGVQINQLLNPWFSLGAAYRFSRTGLREFYPEIPLYVDGSADKSSRADLHQIGLFLLFNHPSGFFARAENIWYIQQNRTETYAGDTAGTLRSVDTQLPAENFPLLNFYVGYRFPRQFGDLTLGLLNALGGDYHLNPLNVYTELPRERVFMVRLRLAF